MRVNDGTHEVISLEGLRSPEQLDALVTRGSVPKQDKNEAPSQKRSWELRVRGNEFADPAEQLQFEVYVAWASRVNADEKEKWPIRDYVSTEKFLDSVEKMQNLSREKLIRTLAAVVCHKSREGAHCAIVHKARKGGGRGEQLTRSDGAVSRRVYLEQGVPSARRLHYGLREDSVSELDNIALHDDYDA